MRLIFGRRCNKKEVVSNPFFSGEYDCNMAPGEIFNEIGCCDCKYHPWCPVRDLLYLEKTPNCVYETEDGDIVCDRFTMTRVARKYWREKYGVILDSRGRFVKQTRRFGEGEE